eukprot:30135-Pelagococcus_subviridis.AAC.18
MARSAMMIASSTTTTTTTRRTRTRARRRRGAILDGLGRRRGHEARRAAARGRRAPRRTTSSARRRCDGRGVAPGDGNERMRRLIISFVAGPVAVPSSLLQDEHRPDVAALPGARRTRARPRLDRRASLRARQRPRATPGTSARTLDARGGVVVFGSDSTRER